MRTKKSNAEVVKQKCEDCGKETLILRKIKAIDKKVCVECYVRYAKEETKVVN